MNNSPAHHVAEPIAATIQLREDLVFTPDLSRDRPAYTIEDPMRGKFFRVGIAEFTFLSLLDGRTPIAEAVGLAAGKLGPQALAEHEALALCRWLLECHLAMPTGSDSATRIASAAARHDRRQLLSMANPLAVRIPLVAPDRMLAKFEHAFGWIFTGPALAVWLGLLAYAVYLAATGWTRIDVSATVILDRENWLRLATAWIVLKLLHETAHGIACKRYGGTVGAAGVTLLFLVPLAYVDVTSSWRFPSKWQRIVTAAAGMYAELFVAAIAMIVWANASPGPAQSMALNLALTASVSTLLFNGNPLVRFDGYFILSDLLEVPNLYPLSQQYLVDFLQTHLLGRQTPPPAGSPHQTWIIGLYAVAAMTWRVVFFCTLALTLVGLWSHLGMLLAAVLLGFAWGIPLAQTVLRLRKAVTQQRA